jgi:hypothetical protein
VIAPLAWRERALWWGCVGMLATSLGWLVLIGTIVALAPPAAVASTLVVVRALGHALVAVAGQGWSQLPLLAPRAGDGPATWVWFTVTSVAFRALAEVHRG